MSKINIRLPSLDYIEKSVVLDSMGEKNYCSPLALSILLDEDPGKICKELEKYGRSSGGYASESMILKYLSERGLVDKKYMKRENIVNSMNNFMKDVRKRDSRIRKFSSNVIERFSDLFEKHFSKKALVIVGIGKNQNHMVAFHNKKLDDIYLVKPRQVFSVIPLKEK